MKKERKVIWARSRAQIPIRVSELMQAGIDLKRKYLYSVEVKGPGEFVIKMRKAVNR
jgi:hypothetical protein